MSQFRKIVCWRDDAVLATTPRDAASLGDGHFQAVHHPLRLRRRRLDQHAAGRWVGESEIVEALQGPLRPDGYLFIPIVGGSGTGKSHLVRWVRDQTKGVEGWEARYLPKNRTGIRQAIEIVIRGLAGPRIIEAREALEAAPAHTETDEVLAERLLDELALLVAHADELPSTAGSTDPREGELRRKLQRDLPDVLRDPVVRRKLVQPGAVVLRLVGLAIRGRQEDDGLDDDATRFLETDLPLTFEEIGDASRGARSLLTQLATIPDLLHAAIALINDALPLAEKRVSVSGQVDLVEIFREVRRALFDADKQLVLFIEDLTVLHGVEREFLDAIVEPAQADDGVMCSLRVIFAVTEGHFDNLDTVRTRCDDAYWLDAPYGADGVDLDEALSFLGRYLNSSRLDPDSVEGAWQQRHDDNWLANACTPCPHRDLCHETFGTSAEGYGLYPLNPSAAGRFVEAVSRERFDPRDVVRELINRFLLHGAVDLRQAEFPSDAALATFDRTTEPLAPLVASELQSRRPVDHERIINTLRYWSDSDEPTNVKEATFSAFAIDLEELDLRSLQQRVGVTTPAGQQQSTASRDENRGSVRQTVDARLPSRWRSRFKELAQWGSGGDLSARATNDLRNLIHKTVIANLEVGSTPVDLGAEFSARRFRAESDIGFVGTVTRQTLGSAVIVVDRNETNAAALQGLILEAELDTSEIAEADAYRRLVADKVEEWIATVSMKLVGPARPGVVAAVEGLIVATTVVGHASGARTATDYLAAMFRPVGPDVHTQLLPRSDRWAELTSQARTLIPKLRTLVEAEFGESRGVRGNVRAIQADRLLPIIETFTTTWTLESTDASITPLMRTVAPALDYEWSSLQRRVTEAAPHVDRDRPWPDQMEKAMAVLRSAHNAGRLRDQTALEELGRFLTVDPDTVVKSFHEAVELVAKDLTLQKKLAVVASSLPDDVAVVHRFVTRAAAAIEGVERDLKERQAASGGATDMEAVVAKVLETTAEFVDVAKELAG